MGERVTYSSVGERGKDGFCVFIVYTFLFAKNLSVPRGEW